MSEPPDIWEKLGIPSGGYNSAVDEQIYGVAKHIVEARENGGSVYCDSIAGQLGMTPEHVELIQYILAGVQYPEMTQPGRRYLSAFCYGSSPRGLFVDDLPQAKRFLAEFEAYLKKWDEP